MSDEYIKYWTDLMKKRAYIPDNKLDDFYTKACHNMKGLKRSICEDTDDLSKVKKIKIDNDQLKLDTYILPKENKNKYILLTENNDVHGVINLDQEDKDILPKEKVMKDILPEESNIIQKIYVEPLKVYVEPLVNKLNIDYDKVIRRCKNNFHIIEDNIMTAYKCICLGYATLVKVDEKEYKEFADLKLSKVENLIDNKICSVYYYKNMLNPYKRFNVTKCAKYLCEKLNIDPLKEFNWTDIPKIEKYLNIGINIYSPENNGGIVYKNSKYPYSIFLKYNLYNFKKTYSLYYSMYKTNKLPIDYRKVICNKTVSKL